MSRTRSALEGPGPLARRLYQSHTRLWHEKVDARLTGPQFTVLVELTERGELDHSALVGFAHLDKSTLSPLLNRLEERGLITIARDDRDHRRKLITATDDGVDIVNRLAPSAAAVGDELLSGLTADERSTLLDLLRRAVGRT
jgi:DNA-binding MarR family transcriptional regulator